MQISEKDLAKHKDKIKGWICEILGDETYQVDDDEMLEWMETSGYLRDKLEWEIDSHRRVSWSSDIEASFTSQNMEDSMSILRSVTSSD